MRKTLFICPRLTNDGDKACYVADGTRIVVLRSEGQHVAFEAQCPHRGMDLYQWGVPLPEGKVMCSSHGYVFDVRSGENLKTRGDAPRVPNLTVFEVIERDGELHVMREENPAAIVEPSRALAG